MTTTETSNEKKLAELTIRDEAKEKLIKYDENHPISRSDLDARLIHLLGNQYDMVFIDANGVCPGRKTELKKGDLFVLALNKDFFYKDQEKFEKAKNNYKKLSSKEKLNSSEVSALRSTIEVLQEYREYNFRIFKILEAEKKHETGFEAALIKDMKEGTIILWADGSKGFANLKNQYLDKKEVLIELINDWLRNDLSIARGNIFIQLENLVEFANSCKKNYKIDECIGHSMMGVGVSALSFLPGFEDIKFRAYSGTLDYRLYNKIKERWGVNNLEGSNLESYITPKEILTYKLEPYQAKNNKMYMKETTLVRGTHTHGAEAYLNKDGLNSNYFEVVLCTENMHHLWSKAKEEAKKTRKRKSSIKPIKSNPTERFEIKNEKPFVQTEEQKKAEKQNVDKILEDYASKWADMEEEKRKIKDTLIKNPVFYPTKNGEIYVIYDNSEFWKNDGDSAAKNEEIKEKARQEGVYTGFAAGIDEENQNEVNKEIKEEGGINEVKEAREARENFIEEITNYINNLLNKNEKVIIKKQENEEIETASFVNPFVQEDGFIDFNGKALKFITRYIKENIENDKEFNSFNKKAFVFIKNGEINIIDENKAYELFSKNFCKDGIEAIKNRSNLRYGNEKYIYEAI